MWEQFIKMENKLYIDIQASQTLSTANYDLLTQGIEYSPIVPH